jgi:hypothetical protein
MVSCAASCGDINLIASTMAHHLPIDNDRFCLKVPLYLLWLLLANISFANAYITIFPEMLKFIEHYV